MQKQTVARRIRLGFLSFVLFVFMGIASQAHLLQGVAFGDIALAMGCVIIAITPVFITMGSLMSAEPESD